MAGRLSQKDRPVLGRVSSYRPTVQYVIDRFEADPSRVTRRPLPGAVISAPKPKKQSILGRFISTALPDQIADPINETGAAIREFINPSYSTQLKTAFEEDPTRTMSEITARAHQLDRQMGILRNKEGEGLAVAVDGIGGTLRRFTAKTISRIAESKAVPEIVSVVKKELPGLSNRQHEILGNVLKDVEDPKRVETILDRAIFASQKTDIPRGRVSKKTQFAGRLSRVLDPEREMASAERLRGRIQQASVFGRTLKQDTQFRAQAKIRKEIQDSNAQEELESLAAEARKYDNVEKFVKNKAKVYHGTTDASFTSLKSSKSGDFGPGIYLTRDKKLAEKFSDLSFRDSSMEAVGDGSYININTGEEIRPPKPGVIEAGIDNLKIKQLEPGEWREEIEKLRDPVTKALPAGYHQKVQQKFIDEGYDGVELTGTARGENDQILVFPKSESKVLTKSQLTDIYNKAKGITPTQSSLPLDKKTPYDTPEIITARREANSVSKTSEINTPERITLREKVLTDMYGNGAPRKERRLDIVMGPPAAGKSSVLVEPLLKEHGALLADSDEFKKLLPEYEDGKGAMAVHEESAQLNGKMIRDLAFPSGDNIVFPTVGKSLESLEKLVDIAKEHGYSVYVHLNDLDPEKAVQRAIARFQETGRFVDPDYVLNQVGSTPRENFDIIKHNEKISGYTKYSNDVAKGDKPKLLETSSEEVRRGSVRRSGDNAERLGSRGSEEGVTEEESLELLAEQQAGSEYALRASAREEERIVSNLEAIFADLKGASLEDLKLKFTEEDLNQAELNYQFAMESLLDDPARALAKYANRNGVLPEVTGTEFITSPKGKGKIKNSRFGREGDDISSQLGFKSSEEARAAYVEYLARKERLTEVFENLKEIRRNIRLAKQKDAFVGAAKSKLAREAARSINDLKIIVQAAERAGFKRGLETGSKKYSELIKRLRDRRKRISAIKKALNLTDSEMKKILGTKDPRFMTKDEFDRYIEGVQRGAEARHKTNQERLLVEAIIKERDLKKVENLQKAMQFPRIEKMSQRQLVEFGDVLSRVEFGDTFLGPRMIQTAVNTDLGNIKTIGDARKKIAEQTGMPFTEEVVGSKKDRWLRDPTLAEKDPLHRMFITEWAAKEADMLNRQYALQNKLNELARASRKSRKQKVFDRLAPQDAKPVQYAQTLPEHLPKLEKSMTPEEIEFGKFLRGFFEKYYQLVQEDAAQRWTLQGVKHSRFKDMYFPHMSRNFFERWKDDGFIRAVKILWDTNVAETKIDFNAFGDRGEVLGYEKWFKNNMKREAEEGAYTKNAASTALAYFHAFERKLLLDSMIPKIKLLEFIAGKKFQTPKSINNPEGTEKTHDLLSKSINEWINNKKGQRVEMLYSQGDRAEAFVDAASTFVSIIDLGGSIAIQVGSGIGGAVSSARGAGIPKYTLGVKRALTKQGRKLGKENPGVIGVTPWFELASVANDAGDTLRGALFVGFGDLAYRARRHMFLGLLTKEEFTSGVISDKRIAEIKLQIGKWHPMPEFDSVAGSTSLIKAAGKYTSWATPIFQSAMQDLGRLRNEIRRLAGTKELDVFIKSPGFRNTLHTALIGIGAYSLGQIVFQPEQEDRDTLLGNMRYVAARETGSILQGASGVGVLLSGRMLGFVQDLWDTAVLLATLQKYETYGPGYKPGDLKGIERGKDLLIPKSIQQFLPKEETPLKTIEDIKKGILEQIESGSISVSAAKELYKKEIDSLERNKRERRFELPLGEYKKDLLQRIESGEISIGDAKKEFLDYSEEQKEYAPESFESDNDADFIEKIQIAAKGLGTDPVTAFQAIFTGEEIRRMDNGEIILHRGKTDDPLKQRDFALEEREERGATSVLILDHTIPLQLGGDNSDGNLRLVPKEEWEQFTPVENYLGRALRREEISAEEAQGLIQEFKTGEITAEEVYEAVD